MNSLRLLVFGLIFSLFCTVLHAQEVGIGQWRDHLPYGDGVAVAQAGNRVYCATRSALFYYDIEDNSVSRLSRVEGLSDMGVGRLAYNKQTNTLVVAYTNTNIDLIIGNQIVNISDIKRKPIIGNKTIYNLHMDQHLVYLACGFGIVVLDLDRQEVKDTYYIGEGGSQINVFDVAVYHADNHLYAATESGLRKVDLDVPNIANFSFWSLDEDIPGSDASFNHLAVFNDQLVLNKSVEGYANDTLYIQENGNWRYFTEPETHNDINNLRVMQDELLISMPYAMRSYNAEMEVVGIFYKYNVQTTPNPNDAIKATDGNYYIADFRQGLVKGKVNWEVQYIKPNGPYTSEVFDVAASGDNVWVVAGGRDGSWANVWRKGAIYGQYDGRWHALTSGNTEALDTISDLVAVAIHPAGNGKVYAASWGWGVLELEEGKVKTLYNTENSSLQSLANSSDHSLRIGGLAFDQQNNLWVSNALAADVLSVRKNDGNWRSFNLGSVATVTDVGEVTIDQSGQVWVLTRNPGVLVFNPNQTIDDTSDDAAKRLSSSAGHGGLPGGKVYCVVADQDGEMWIGTDDGIGVIYTPSNIFTENNYDAQQIVVSQGGYNQYLLDNEVVTAIAVDGANRKWIGTERSGVFLVSEDGTEQLLHFSQENSPLFSNSVSQISIGGDGEVFFGTDKGLISYKGTATEPQDTNSDVYAYPNPVPHAYDGPIAIKGLVAYGDVKITDVSGNLVYATRAEGSQAIWNGMNFNGERVQTGVYLVYVTNDDGSETVVTKILLIH